ncbi:Transposase, IS891/IS1136/IS1341 (plasmid) [Trichormus variabilis ATCC 29413]|uniref:Transposase, IS891/IS1136/IS1341 n=3 Tax=Nostocales TaxID=1161 RepID=Q3M2J7_TRIV2|nr:Transposase, IS891/IS1136/IS1341 [Trichormus variabilis ATCC 29413]
MTLIPSYQLKEQTKQSSSRAGFLATLNSLTWKDKYSFLSLVTPVVKSSKKSEADSTSEEKSYLPYWNEFSQAMSEWLWSAIKTDYADLDLNSSNGCAKNAIVNSWFSTKLSYLQSEKWLRIFWQSSMSSVADCTDSENTNRKSVKVCTQYRMILTLEQEQLLMKWVRLNRKTYNMAIAYLNQKQGFDRTGIGGTGKQAFKTFFKAHIRPDWLKNELPAAILDQAVMEAYSAWSTTQRHPKTISKGKDKKPHPQAGLKIAKFRSIRDSSQTLQFKIASDLNKGRLLPQYWGELPAFECVDNGVRFCPISNPYTPEVTYKHSRFYISLPEDVEVVDNNKDAFIAFDPGVRTFLTGFDGQKMIEFGNGDIHRIVRLCQWLDKLRSFRDLSKGFKNRHLRYRLSQKMKRVTRRIRNLVDEMHRQVASWVAKNYRVIALPTYETSQMVCRAVRKIKSKTARSMLSFAPYRFSQVLEHQCARNGSVLIRHTEEFTSKTCSRCGHIHYSLGGQKIFKCSNCGNHLPRDWNGALGNFLKALWDTTLLNSASFDCVQMTVFV